jgi:RNA polymerase sigma factor (sigma-70 family)
MKHDPEHVLIDRILAGEQSLYAGLVDRYKNYALTIAMKIVQNKAEAEEIAQDSFIKAFNGLKNFNRDSKFSTWLYRIAFNTAISYKRRHKQPLDSIEHAAISLSQEGEGALERKDKKKYIDLALAKLNEADRTALTLFYLEEFSLEEIAEITQTPSNTIKVRIHRARQRVAEELKSILNQEALTL